MAVSIYGKKALALSGTSEGAMKGWDARGRSAANPKTLGDHSNAVGYHAEMRRNAMGSNNERLGNLHADAEEAHSIAAAASAPVMKQRGLKFDVIKYARLKRKAGAASIKALNYGASVASRARGRSAQETGTQWAIGNRQLAIEIGRDTLRRPSSIIRSMRIA
jgi:hypothetical protein